MICPYDKQTECQGNVLKYCLSCVIYDEYERSRVEYIVYQYARLMGIVVYSDRDFISPEFEQSIIGHG